MRCKMKLALQLYSVREDLEKYFFGTLRQVKEMGYEGCELAGFYGNEPEAIRSFCDEIGLPAISAHVTYGELISDIEKTVKMYKAVGCKYIAIPYLSEDLRYGTEKYNQVVSDIKEIGKVCNEYGITLLYHNHDFEFAKTEDGTYALDDLYNTVSKDLLQTEIDTCWVKVAGVNPCEYVEKYTNRAPVVHLKDFAGERNKNMYKLIGIDSKESEEKNTFEFRPLGKGVQDIPSIVESAKKAGAEWVVAEQDEPSMGMSRMECAKASIEYMKNINY